MKNLLLRLGAIALGLLAMPAFGQSADGAYAPAGKAPMQNPCVVQSDASCLALSTDNPLPIGQGGQRYTLLTGATPGATQSPPTGIYNLQLPATFNGATITLTLTTANNIAVTHAYTSSVAAKTCFRLSNGTTVSAAATGGTPSGTTILAGAAQCSQPSLETYVQLALTANTAAQIATPITGMINGLVCTASSTNAADVLVGPSTVNTTETGTGTGYPMVPGGPWAAGINTTANTWFISSANAVIFCHGN